MVSKAKSGKGNKPKRVQPQHPTTGRFIPANTILPASHPSNATNKKQPKGNGK